MMAVFHDKIPGDLARKPNLMLQEYHDQDLNPCIQVYLPHNLRSEEFIKLFPKTKDSCAAFSFPALNNWVSKTLSNLQSQQDPTHPFHKHPYALKEIDVQAVDWFWRDVPGKEDKLGFMKIQSKIETEPYLHDDEKEEKADWLPGAVFLRGGSVAVLIIVQPEDASGDDEKQVIFTIQPRLAIGSLAVTEIPAGMLDGNSLRGAAASELEEEAGLKVNESDLINMSELAAETNEGSSEKQETQTDHLEQAMYPSPGACDEFIPLFLCQKRLTRRHMSWLSGKATGLRDEGERITLKLVPFEKAWRIGAQDGKALAALALYEGLKRECKLSEMPTETEKEPVDVQDD